MAMTALTGATQLAQIKEVHIMKDLQQLFKEAKEDLEAIDIKYGDIYSVVVNTRAKKRWGQCQRIGSYYKIEISDRLLQDDVSYEATMNTLIHEILHTCPNCMNHGAAWKKLAERVNSFYPQYNIKRITSSEEKGIAADRMAEYKYSVVCKSCGAEAKYMKRGKVIQLLEKGSKSCRCYNCNNNSFDVFSI